VALLCLPSIAIIYARYVLSKDTNALAQFEEKHECERFFQDMRLGSTAKQRNFGWTSLADKQLSSVGDSMLSGSTVTTAWRVLGLWIEETASRYGG
jgi:hypothetical protein